MPRKALDKLTISPEKKLHYKLLGEWLKVNPEIKFKKLAPIGFSINISTIPENKAEEFIRIATFREN